MLMYIEHYLSMAGIRLYDEDGQGLIEYVLIAAFIAVAAIVAMTALGGQLGTSFDNLKTKVTVAP